jgi:hypothetical protein
VLALKLIAVLTTMDGWEMRIVNEASPTSVSRTSINNKIWKKNSPKKKVSTQVRTVHLWPKKHLLSVHVSHQWLFFGKKTGNFFVFENFKNFLLENFHLILLISPNFQ